MKLFRITLILTSLLSVILFNWNCSNEDAVNNNQNPAINITDSKDELVTLQIHEYARVIPQSGFPYYMYRQVATFSCSCVNSILVNYGSFSTPANLRVENGDTIQTQYFRFTKSVNWECQPGTQAAIFYVPGILNEYIFYNTGSPDDCGSELFFGTYSDQDEPIYISQNTNVSVTYGSGAFDNAKSNNTNN